MNIERISESEWTSILDGSRDVQIECLPFQLFLANLRNRFQAKNVSARDCIRELKTFYAKFSRLPAVEKDFSRIGNKERASTNRLLDLQETARRITAGQSLMLAGEEDLLRRLPPGNWIGGTIPYFMTRDGACLCKDKIFVSEIPGEFQTSIRSYAEAELPGLYGDAGEGTLSFVILPADSPVHAGFALHAPHYSGFALQPLVGWIAGVDLAAPEKAAPKVFCGGPEALENAAVVMRLKLPADRLAQIHILNLFQPGSGDTIRFPATGFSAITAIISGREQNLAEYLQRLRADPRLPLVADYCGAMVNVSLKEVDVQRGLVEFYAPVVSGVDYKLAQPVEDYVSKFEARLKDSSPDQDNVLFSCNCVLNYLYCNLEGYRAGPLAGPVTFGEIAFQLLNQTLVYVEVVKVAASVPGGPDAELSNARFQLSAAHEELQASESRFRALSESAPLGIFLTDGAGNLLYENPLCRTISGLSSGEGAGRDWLRNVHPTDLPAVAAAIENCQREHRELDHEFRFVHPDGQVRWVHSRTSFLRSETGEITGQVGVVEDVTARKQAEVELERVNRDLIRASREAGVAELASGVLHNVKNVITSISVSAGVVAEQLHRSKSANLDKVTAMLREHSRDLGSFLTEDPKGKLLPAYLEKLAEQLAAERRALLGELQEFEKNVQHIKEIVTMQQDCARLGGTSEKARPVDLIEDSLRFSTAALARHGIQVAREYDSNLPEISVEKHKVLQILVNLIRNAKQACQASDRPDKKLILRATNGGEFIHLVVTDNGIGIPAENLGRIFEHGFTTKKTGHGFGLHSAALTVRDLGGNIQVHSDGPGTGATFILKLPCRPAPSHQPAPKEAP